MTTLRRLLAPPALVAFAGVAVVVGVGLFVVPPDRLQGQVQRIMYVHVPSAWIAYLAFFVTFVASIRYLWRKDLGADRLRRQRPPPALLVRRRLLAVPCPRGPGRVRQG